MEEEPNPFQSPIADSIPDSVEVLSGYQPEGSPHPNVLAWIGVILAVGIVGSFFWGNLSFGPALLILPARIAWVIYSRVQMRRHEDTWSPGSRSFLMAVWVVNLLILSIDGMLILLFATCLVAFG